MGELDLAWSDETDLERVTYQVHDLVPDCIAELQEHLDVDPYAMLYRLQGVCKLAENGDVDRLITTNEFNNMLWGGSVEAHIEKMQTLYDSLPADERPDWCTQDMIDTYAEHLGVTPHVTPEVKAASQRPSLASKRQEATKAPSTLPVPPTAAKPVKITASDKSADRPAEKRKEQKWQMIRKNGAF